MVRALAAMLAVAALTGAGCRYCCTPYDECGPVYEGGHCRVDCVDGRMGSAFAPGAIPEGAIVDEGEVDYEEPAGI